MLLPVLALATVTKYTFNNVVMPDNTITEVQAVVRNDTRNPNSRCDYYTDNYVAWLGYYMAPVVAGTDTATVLNFCVNHFGDKVLK